MSGQAVHTVCPWCGTVVIPGDTTQRWDHFFCRSCMDRTIRETGAPYRAAVPFPEPIDAMVIRHLRGVSS